ncbi:MAG TPA: VOC family protein [Solirubrobacteraceae bacterium]|nr:VOC family protein [Solirubrobacteraceae bacterium]
MGERSGYAPGTFCWVELATTDHTAAKAFYAGLFGWVAEDRPAGEGVSYSMMSRGGRHVAAIAPQPERQRAAGAPPSWNSYVSVSSADEVLERARELGGAAHAPASDVFDAGRMAVVQDPQGAYFELWEPREHPGAGLVNAPGALTWNELASSDPEAAARFYGELLGWTSAPFEGAGEPYLSMRNGDGDAAGIRGLRAGETGPHWLVYFGTDDVAAALAETERRGGRVLAAERDIGVGRVAVAADPQGARFALFAGHLDP